MVASLISLLAGTATIGCGSSPSSPPTSEFAAVQAIFDAHCVACHSANLTPRPGVLSYPQLPLTAGQSHAALVGRPAHEACGGTLVTAGNPGASYLEAKLTQSQPCEGARMPTGEAILPQPLSQAELDTISAWITAGAPD